MKKVNCPLCSYTIYTEKERTESGHLPLASNVQVGLGHSLPSDSTHICPFRGLEFLGL